MTNYKFYVTRWKRKYDGCGFGKIMQSLRSFHFDTLVDALKFFDKLDSAVYRAHLKSFDEVTERVKILRSL